MRALVTILLIFVSKAVSLCDNKSSVELTNRTYNGIKYKDGEYFVNKITRVERGCVCMKETCIRKCCAIGKALDKVLGKCVNFTQEFDPPVWEESKVNAEFKAANEFHWLTNIITCSKALDERRLYITDVMDKYYLKTDGELFTMADNVIKYYSFEKYCIDNVITYEKDTPMNQTITLDGLVCFVPVKEENQYAVNSACMAISCFFIILTISVYALLPSLRTLHGMVLMAYLSCILVMFIFVTAMEILLLMDDITPACCTGMTIVIYFSMLATFFWLNVMCYDLWSTFSLLKITRGFPTTKNIKFLKYCAYAFGVPTGLTILLAALEFSDLPVKSKYLPNLRKACYIEGISKLIYLYGPIIVICIANLVLFILTAVQIAKTRQQTKMLKKANKQRFSLYIKLFIVTGINWILEVLSIIYPKLPIWKYTDVYNVLIGLILFVLFVCKKKIFRALKNRYKQLRGLPMSSTSTFKTTTTSSRTLTQSKDNIAMQTTVLPQSMNTTTNGNRCQL